MKKITMFKPGKYINNITGLQFFQLFRFGILFLISIIFSKSALKQGEIGIYETFLLIAGGVSFFWISGIIQSLMPLFRNQVPARSTSKDDTGILFNSALLMLSMSTMVGIFVFLVNDYLAGLLSLHTSSVPYIKILVAYIILSGPNNLIEYIFLLKNQSKNIVLFSTISLTLQLLCVTMPVLLTNDLGYGLYGLLAVNALKFLFLIYLIRRYSKIQVRFDLIKKHLHLASPLIFSIFLSGSASYFDGFLVSYHFDEARFAIFRYGARELPFVVLLANAFSNAMIPEFSTKGTQLAAFESMRKKSKKLMTVLFPLSILFLLTSKWLYPVVFNPDFLPSAAVFNVYLLLILSRLLFPQTLLIGWQKTRAIMVSSLIELTINVGLSVWFIQTMGIVGVAYATVIAYMVQKIILIAYLWIRNEIHPAKYIPISSWIGWSVILMLVYAGVNIWIW
ncbi:MAG: polysaccharide biosynthesis C-terminal domain-containing protein [Candidatus Delongbacteria bacterium]|nr:polysaccharide biosynthesis C-terminal domain-containing protein [Candidatus Delongbacteria bacterium]